MIRVLYIFDLDVLSDARCQKEISLLNNQGYDVNVLEWNKDADYSLTNKEELIRGVNITVKSKGIKVEKGKGFKQNILSLIKYELFIIGYLLKNINNYDIVHCCNLDSSFVSTIIAKMFSKKVIYDIYDDYADSHKCGHRLHKIIKKLDKYIQKKADAVIICSEKRLEQLGETNTPIYIVHNSPDIYPDLTTNYKKIENEFRIVYVGNLCEKRMITELLQIVSQHSNWRILCGGTGVLEKQVFEMSQSFENIEYFGKMKYEEVIDLENSCDVIPALYDPSLINNTYAAPNKFYEAMFLGKPTIMVKNTGMDDVVLKENTGLVIEFNKDQLERALETIYENQCYWLSSADRIKNVYKSKYSWEKMKTVLLSAYNDVLKG